MTTQKLTTFNAYQLSPSLKKRRDKQVLYAPIKVLTAKQYMKAKRKEK